MKRPPSRRRLRLLPLLALTGCGGTSTDDENGVAVQRWVDPFPWAQTYSFRAGDRHPAFCRPTDFEYLQHHGAPEARADTAPPSSLAFRARYSAQLPIPDGDTVAFSYVPCFGHLQTEQGYVLIQDGDTWRLFWERHVHLPPAEGDAQSAPVPPLPPVDFSTEVILGLVLGSGGCGPYYEIVHTVQVHNDTLQVLTFDDRYPEDVCLAVYIERHFVRLPRLGLPILVLGEAPTNDLLQSQQP